MKYNLVYITAKDKAEAKQIGQVLVEERLAACANIIDKMESLYWWAGKVQHDNESVLIVKTKESLVSALIEKVKSLHSYSCPCVVSLPILDGNKAFLKWIQDETK